MADEKRIRQIRALADDDPRRQRYVELLAQAGRMTIPRLHPGDANSVMSQLATMLDAPVPIVGAMTEHAAAWRACLLEQGLGDLLAGLSKQVLTIFFCSVGETAPCDWLVSKRNCWISLSKVRRLNKPVKREQTI